MDDDRKPQTIEVELSTKYKRKRVKNKTDLPSWFNIENYRLAKDFSSVEWFNELALRAEFYSMPLKNELDIPVLFYEDKNNPLKDISRKRFFGASLESDGSFQKMKQYMKLKKDLVCDCEGDLVFTGLVSQNKDYPCNKLGMFETQIPLLHDFKKDFPVNLLCPDNILFEHFKIWLKKKRTIGKEDSYYGQLKKTQTISEISESKINKWYCYGLLPFLDLHQWSLINHVKIEQSVYADSIFIEFHEEDKYSDDIKTEKTFQKTTQNLAKDILSDLKTLGQQLIEISNISNTSNFIKDINNKTSTS